MNAYEIAKLIEETLREASISNDKDVILMNDTDGFMVLFQVRKNESTHIYKVHIEEIKP